MNYKCLPNNFPEFGDILWYSQFLLKNILLQNMSKFNYLNN